MKTTTRLVTLLFAATLAVHTYGGDARVTLDSADGSSAFTVRDADSNELARVQSDGKVSIGTNAPAYTLDVSGDINLTGTLRTNGVAWTPLTSFTETDPVFAASAAAGLDAEKITNWDTAFGWGDHALAGYLTDYTETDPVFTASVAAGITADSTNAWNAKLDGTGTEGYLSKFTTSCTVGDSALFSDADGKVGIGTNAPAYKLHVAGSLNATAITINGTPVASSTDTYWSTAGSGAIQYSGGNVGVGTATPAASAQLDVSATDKGMLVPRLTQSQRDAVASPATGLLVYQTDNNPGFYFYDGAQWSSISAGAGAVTDVSASAPLASSGGTTPTLSMPAATSSANGYLTSTDWTTFNNKVATTRTVSTTAPLTGGGALSGNLTLSMPVATASANGYLSSANWTTFNAKESALTFSAPLSRSVNTISLPVATTSVSGYLSSTDWTTFNNKVSAGANSTITSLSGLTTDLSVAQGGTGASTLTGYVKGNGTSAMTASATIPGSAISGDISGTATKATNLVGGNSTTLLGAIGYQSNTDTTTLLAPNTTTTKKFLRMTGTGSNGAAPVWDTAAAAGANSDITSLSGLTTDITVAQGGTGASTASDARTNLGLGSAATYAASANNVAGNVMVRDASGDVGVHSVFADGNVQVTGTLMVNGLSVVANPAGAVMQFAGAAAPTGYLLCQGQAVSRTTYSALYAVVGNTYGAGDGSTTFNVPNLMGNVPVGRKSTDTSFDVLGEIGGAKTHTLTTAEMPAHTHAAGTLATASTGAHTHTVSDQYNSSELSDDANDRTVGSDSTTTRSVTSSSAGAHTHTISGSTDSVGSNGAHNNLQPYIVLNYIIKY